MGVGIGEWAETVVVFLASRIPQRELDVLAVYLHIGDVVLEHGGDIDLECVVVRRLCLSWMELDVGVYLGRVEQDTDLWERSFREDDQQTGLLWWRKRGVSVGCLD